MIKILMDKTNVHNTVIITKKSIHTKLQERLGKIITHEERRRDEGK